MLLSLRSLLWGTYVAPVATYGDRVRETSTSTGVGPITLLGAPLGYRTFSARFPGVTSFIPYCVEGVNPDGSQTGEWEVILGDFDGVNTLTRVTTLSSSNGGAPVSFSAGDKNVFSTAPGDYLDTFTSTQQGTVPASGGGTTKFLRADGTFDVPPGTITSPGGATTQVQYNIAGAFAGNSNFTYDAGTNTVTFGSLTGSALGMTIQPKAPTALEDAGLLTIRARDAVKANSGGGVISLSGGKATGTGTGGDVYLSGGASVVGGIGGSISLTAGSGKLFGGGFYAQSGGTANEAGANFVMEGGNPGVAGGSFAMGTGFSNVADGGSFTMFLAGGATSDGFMEWQDSLGSPFMRFQTATPGGGAKQMGFFAATPVVQQTAANTSSVHAALKNYGLLTTGSTYASDVAGSTTQVQYNNSGAFAASSNFTYDSGTNTVTFGNITGSALGMTIQPKAPTMLENPGILLLKGRDAVKANTSGGDVVLQGGAKTGTGEPGSAKLVSQDGLTELRVNNSEGFAVYGKHSSQFIFNEGIFSFTGSQTAPPFDSPNQFIAGINSTLTGNVPFQFLTDSQKVFEFGEPTFGSQVIAFFGVTPATRRSAYTQTFSTASRTVSNPTFTNLVTTAATNIAPYGFTTQAQADDIATKVNQLAADVAILRQLINSLIDDSQAYGLAQ